MLATHFFKGESTAELVLRAAMVQFSAHGYQRTSMEDIAKQARVSRPTLYSYFKNKEAILHAVSMGIHDTTLQNIKAALSENVSLDDRLLNAIAAWSTPFQEILFGSPHGAELIGASSAMASDISINAQSQFQSLIVSALRKETQRGQIDLSRSSLTFKTAAELLILAVNGLSSGQTDAKTYHRRLKNLVTLFMTAVSLEKK